MVIALGVAAGLAIRIVLLRTSVGVLDSDEAVVGLMARHFNAGSFRAFFWGQTYGGTLETVITAGVFRVIGTSTAALKAVPLVLNGVAAALVWRIGRRLMGADPAILAGLVVWLWPANYLWWSIKARGFYEAALCITLASVLIVLHIARDRDGNTWTTWAALGLLAGLGWWQTPQVLYILGPAGVWLALVRRGRVAKVAAAVPGLLIGALPWLVANVGHGFASLSPPAAPIPGTYSDHLLTFVRDGLPMTFGLRYVYLTRWIVTPHVGVLLYAAFVAVLVPGVLQRRKGSWLVALILVAYPFLHAVLTLSSVVAEGRYTLFLLPWLALAMARACRHWLAATALLGVILCVSVIGLLDLRGQTSPYAPDHRVPTSLTGLERSLTDHGITRVWANYWIAYRVTFDTRERIIAASAQNPRYLPYNVVVGDVVSAYVFIRASRDVPRF
ncbi:MAG: glycosyltransferase family 39 protein, partial [Acidimicrobiales bacterium]